jgi:hypothetical protein
MSDDLPHPDRPDPPPPGQRRTVRPPARPALAPEDPSSGPLNADRLTVVAHELRNMLDGSMRWLGLAAAALPEGEVAGDADRLCAAREQILTVQGTLERMSSMVNAALRSRTVPIGSPLLGVSSVVTLGMAIDHALDVVRPLAHERGVQVRVTIDPEAGGVPAGPLYTVVLNGVINAVQSIGRAAERDTLNPGGLVEIRQSELETQASIHELTAYAQTLVAETEALSRRYGAELPLLDTIGYAEARQRLAGALSESEAIALTEQRTRQFSKRQRTWFRRRHAPIWLEGRSPEEQLSQALQVVARGLG